MGQFGLQIAIWLILANMRVSLNVQILRCSVLGCNRITDGSGLPPSRVAEAPGCPHIDRRFRGEHPLSTEGLGGPRMRDPYEILGVAKGASAAEIKSAFRKRAKTLHPDANRHDPKAATRFSELNAAYE